MQPAVRNTSTYVRALQWERKIVCSAAMWKLIVIKQDCWVEDKFYDDINAESIDNLIIYIICL